MYLISSKTKHKAKQIAKQKQIKEWKYITNYDRYRRRQQILGRKVDSIEQLIGNFSADEMEYLIKDKE